MMLLPREAGDRLHGLMRPDSKENESGALHDRGGGAAYGEAAGGELRHTATPWAQEHVGGIEAGGKEAASHVGCDVADANDPDAHRSASCHRAQRAIGANL
jgi:hypothetical protein